MGAKLDLKGIRKTLERFNSTNKEITKTNNKKEIPRRHGEN